MRAIFLVSLLCVALVSILPDAGQSQGLGSLFPGTNPVEATGDQDADPRGSTDLDASSDGTAPTSSDTLAPDDALAEDGAPSSMLGLQDRVAKFRDALVERVLTLPVAFNEVLYILRAASPDGTLWAFGKTLVLSLMMFGVGAIVEREVYGRFLMKKLVTKRISENPDGYYEKIPFLALRFFVGLGGVLVSMAVAYVLGFSLFGPLTDTAMQFTVSLINIGYFACRVVAILWRMILSPFLSQYRIPALSDRDAKRLHLWLWFLASCEVCAILFGFWIAELGLNYDAYAFFASTMSAILVLLNILLVLVNRRAISHALRHGKPPEETSMTVRFLSRAWVPAVFAYVIFAWVELTIDLVLGNPSSVPLIAGAYGILLTIIVVYGLINFGIERSFTRSRRLRLLNAERDAQSAADASDHEPESGRSEEETPASAVGPQRSLNTFEELARRVSGILSFVAGTYAFFYIWDNDGAEMIESFANQLLDILVVIFIGYVVYHAFRIWIDSKIAEETTDDVEIEPGDEGGASSASRLATLLPLFRNFTLILVVLTILLIVLMEIGVNVGPLFAGAGIIGIAIGFGSQALVRDVFAGAFFLFDDAFRKGEYLDVGNVKGTVEKISVRSFQLRHHLGALHTIPFGELQVITNYSRDWVMMKLPLRVTYDTDVEQVRKLIKKLGQDLLTDPEIGESFILPLKSQGVIEMQDSAMIIRVKFMTKPGDQWLVRKKVYQEIRNLFEREGIKFAHREVTVRLADAQADDLTDAQKHKIAAAAHASLDEDLLEDDDRDDLGGDDR
ncbi:mechanosensitive ion channel family protein [Sulfitobacter sp. S0837]|uniref:mechanosensitive ion channel family protein n=1 Tax=Sulfitobacter maritimus TaxID=2741719 RepID=UPI0015837AD9|nr:mechanosensitive ion channel family protein [Sulfitobacter maritimus]NUH64065.1 mechanosensitive ion channel family protein [Sulfitobacter maritimus]